MNNLRPADIDHYIKKHGAAMPADVRKAAGIAKLTLQNLNHITWQQSEFLQRIAARNLSDFASKAAAWKKKEADTPSASNFRELKT